MAVVVACALTSSAPAAAQGVLDLFGSHFGEVRNPSLAPQIWGGVNFMLLTQFDQRYDPQRAAAGELYPFDQYDDLETTVGYNYGTVGAQRAFMRSFLGKPISVEASLHGGVTHDKVTRAAQDFIHDFLEDPRVYRGHVSDDEPLVGLDGRAIVWLKSWLGVGPHGAFGTFHREVGATATARKRTPAGGWLFAGQLRIGKVFPSSIRPARVGDAMEGGYVAGQVTAEWVDVIGVSLWLSEGIFRDESDFLFSAYVMVPLGARWRFRFETVNDMFSDILGRGLRDHGPTGGVRLAFVRR